jgi:malate/lactate dehydrogenase
MSNNNVIRITIVGAGTIGLSFAALHLTQPGNVEVTIYDVNPDIKMHVYDTLPGQ